MAEVQKGAKLIRHTELLSPGRLPCWGMRAEGTMYRFRKNLSVSFHETGHGP